MFSGLVVAFALLMVVGSDLNRADNLVWSIVGGDPDEKFQIDSVTGELTTLTLLGASSPAEYQLSVQLSDGGLSDTETVVVEVGPPSEIPSAVFIDTVANTFEEGIDWLAYEAITGGCNPPTNDMYCPDNLVSRGQMAAFLVRALGLPPTSIGYFTDDDGTMFEANSNSLREAGITTGCGGTNYCPNGAVTRGQMAAFLVRALGYADGGGGNIFVDTSGSIFEADIDKLATEGVTRGCNPPTNDLFCPDAFVTRGQMATFLNRALSGL